MKKKYYAVRSGRVPGIYTSWEDCKAQVEGFSGAEYKGFEDKNGALEYMGVKAQDQECSSCAAKAYTDGSYNVSDGRYSYGVVLFIGDEKLTFSKAFENNEDSSMRNVAGEIEGAKFVMDYCVRHDIPSLEIVYDYEGVEKWCTKEWKTNKEGTKNYHFYYESIKDKLYVKFTKVKGHSGDKYNDEADKLAKQILGI